MADSLVVVTGATGFIAGHCVQELLRYGYAVRGTVRDLSTAKVGHLHEMAERGGGSLELVEASLDADTGWADAVDGCSFVWHLASPNPPAVPKDADEVIRPAVEGTLRVLRAAAGAGTVRRVVLTSSTDAMTHGHAGEGSHVYTEADWSVADRSGPYQKSKAYAERAAWDFVADRDLELVTVNPGLVLGPLLRAERPTSIETIRLLLSHAVPAIPRLSFSVVDVRDIAAAHRLAMEVPAAAGHRYICAAEHMWMQEMAQVLAAEFRPRGYRIPVRALPYWLMWTIARFDPTIRLALNLVGVEARVSAAKAMTELGWSPRPARESIVDTAESLLEFRVVSRSAAERPDVAARVA